MNALLFRPDFIAQNYNCSGRSYEEWKALGTPNVILGFIYVILGAIYLALLLPFMVVFMKSDLMKYSCYKIMFFLGIIDCIELPIGSFFGGYAAAVGMVYCMAPITNYIAGNIALACWCSGSTTCMLLAINRCIDLVNPRLGQQIFGGHKTIWWLMIPVASFIYFSFIHTTASFNSNLYAFFFDPFVGTPERGGLVDSEHYPHMEHSVHNVVIVIGIFTSYSSLLVYLCIQTRKSQMSIKTSKIQRQTFIQCTMVCLATFVAGVIYVYMQFLPTPMWIVIVGEIAWQTSHGVAGISYAFLNATMRKELLKIFCSNYAKTVPFATNTNMKKLAIASTDHISELHY